jgi:mono/diheme cytochrome c family protein
MRNRSSGAAVGRYSSIAIAAVAWLCTPAWARADSQDHTQIERGRYLTTAADCAGCHTRPGSGQAFAGGRPIETPFGSMRAPNITSDAQTGIGAWTDDQFDAALRRGRRRDGSRLYPAMPFNYYTKMSRDDVTAIRAYLATVAPVHNVVIANTLPFPFNVRAAMRAWDALYFHEGEYRADPAKSPEWNRGAYLVEGPGHCGACHTPKSVLGADKNSDYLRGSTLQGWFAPDITSDARVGLGNWTIDDIVAYLKTGHNRVTAATGPMAEEISLSSTHMTDPDLKAIAAYLASVPGSGADVRAIAADDPMMRAGNAIYRDQCSACHGLDGRGVPKLFPSLAESSMVRSTDPTSLIRIVLRGARSVATASEPTSPGMPSYGAQLDDAQVAAVLTFVRNAWGSAAAGVAPTTVRNARSALAVRSD